MTTPGEQLASKIQARVTDLDAVLQPLDERAWSRRCEAEAWSIGLVAYHIGRGLARQAGWIEDMLQGAAPHRFSWDATHELNASIAAENGSPAKAGTLRFLSEQSERLGALARMMTDEQLDAVAALFNQRGATASYVIGGVALDHIESHAASIRRTLDALAKSASER